MITVYTTHCPRCKILEKTLLGAGFEFAQCEDVDTMVAMGFQEIPQMEVDGKIYGFKEAIKWIRENTNNG